MPIALLSCNQKVKSDCDSFELKELIFLNDSISINIPEKWKESNDLKFHDKAAIVNREFVSSDSTSFIYIYVADYNVYPNVSITEAYLFNKLRAKMLTFTSKDDSLVQDNTIQIGGYKVNFLKYSRIEQRGTIFNAHIGFLKKPNEQVEIQMRIFDTNYDSALKLVECIFESLKIK